MNLSRRFLRLPVIVPAFPYDIINGTLANADEVMANFNWLLTNVNDNAQQIGVSGTTSSAQVSLTSGVLSPSTGVALVLGDSATTNPTVASDPLSEFGSNGKFTPVSLGTYFAMATVYAERGLATMSGAPQLLLAHYNQGGITQKNYAYNAPEMWTVGLGGSTTWSVQSIFTTANLGDYLLSSVNFDFSAGQPYVYGYSLSFFRLY